MGSTRPTSRPRSLSTGRDSLWATRQSYRVYRSEVGRILSPKGAISRPTSPAVQRMFDDVDSVRVDVIQNSNRAELVAQLQDNPAVRLSKVPSGSHMLVIFQGGNEETNVKHFNDELLGPEITNVLISMRDEVIAAGLKYFKLAEDDTCVSSDHKTCHYHINQTQIRNALGKLQETLPIEAFQYTTAVSAIGSDQSLEVITYVMRRIEKDIQEAARRILEEKISSLLDEPEGMPQIRKIRTWLETQLGNIKLNFGLSEEVHTTIGDIEALKERFWVDQQATWSARKAEGSTEHGKAFDMITFIDDIAMIREDTLNDPNLADFFETVTIDGIETKLLKIAIIHNLRKWATVKKQYAGDTVMLAKYKKLQKYYQAINGIDYINPWVDIESAHAAISHFDRITTSTSNISEVKKAILMDERDDRDCTPAYFHHQGTEFNSAYYVSFDAIGIGDTNARDIEFTTVKAINHLNTHRNTRTTKTIKTELKDIVMSVGSKISTVIREKFEAARAEINASLKNVRIFTTRGGDEWHVLIGDPTNIEPEVVFITIATIAQKHGLRATVSYKETIPDGQALLQIASDLDRIEAHYRALDLNERNNATIKGFEKAGLPNIIAIPGEGPYTAALFPHKDSFIEISNISAIAGAIEKLKSRELTVNADTILSVIVGASV